MFLPYRVDAEVKAEPISNYIVMAVTLIFFIPVYFKLRTIDAYVLDGFNPSLLFHGFMHANWPHILGNMYYLFIFGSVICSRIGNATYPFIYLCLIFLSGSIHLLVDGNPAIGASGAVNGILGIFFFLYPRAKIHCAWTLIWAWGKGFSIHTYWLIGLWFIKDLYGAINSEAPIAYSAHVGGMLSGLLVGWFMLEFNWIKRDSYQPNLLEILGVSKR